LTNPKRRIEKKEEKTFREVYSMIYEINLVSFFIKISSSSRKSRFWLSKIHTQGQQLFQTFKWR